jgi:hypothetical protein
MSLLARLDVERSFRIPVDRPATLRDSTQSPVDVAVDNLSGTGCLLRAEEDLAVDTIVSLGIPGIGVHQARIIRVDRPYYGCEFVMPISLNSVQIALKSETTIERMFPQWAVAGSVKPIQIATSEQAKFASADLAHTSANQAQSIVARDRLKHKLPLGTRLVILIGASIVPWGLIAFGIHAMMR